MIAGIVASTVWRRAPPSGELELIFTDRDLGVLFYFGEKHPGDGGGESDTEWLITPVDAVTDPDGAPYPGVMGQFVYDVGIVLRGGDGPITVLSGWKMHYLVLPAGGGTTVQVLFTNKDIMTSDGYLDAETAPAFNAWYASLGQRNLQLLDENDRVLYEVPMTAPWFEGSEADPLMNKGGAVPGTGWSQTNREMVKKIRLIPDDGMSDSIWETLPVDAVLNDAQDQPTATPLVDYMGQFSVDIDATTSASGGTGARTTRSGFKIHYVVRQVSGGSECDVYVSNQDHVDFDLTLDPATADAFDAWWAAKGPLKADLISYSVQASVPFPAKEPGKAAKVTIPDLYWPTDGKDSISSVRLAPVV